MMWERMILSRDWVRWREMRIEWLLPVRLGTRRKGTISRATWKKRRIITSLRTIPEEPRLSSPRKKKRRDRPTWKWTYKPNTLNPPIRIQDTSKSQRIQPLVSRSITTEIFWWKHKLGSSYPQTWKIIQAHTAIRSMEPIKLVPNQRKVRASYGTKKGNSTLIKSTWTRPLEGSHS